MKQRQQWLHDFFGHPWVDCKEAADGADDLAECGKRGTSWGASVTHVPVALPCLKSIFDFVPGIRALAGPSKYSMYATRPDPLYLPIPCPAR